MISYRIDVADVHAHLFSVTLTVPQPAAEQTISLPVWIPGSYLVREFARHLSALTAQQAGQELRCEPVDKASWRVRCSGRGTLTLRYQVYAFDPSVRAAFLDARRGFFNGTSVCLRVHGREGEPHGLTIGKLPAGWEVATAMPAGVRRHAFRVADYDALVDHPFELGSFWRGSFNAAGVAHEFVVAGALPGFDGARLLADTQRVCEAEIEFWHGPGPSPQGVPFERYVFMLNAVEDGYGGLEHRASTALIAARRDLPRGGITERSDGYVTLLGLISHEYFHSWNVKRLRPANFARLDYTQENYTELLWFFEGFTSYYDDLFLLRAGLVDPARYLQLVAKAVNGVLSTPGRKLQSLAQASFDAWIKYYRSDENTPNVTISYYTKGSLVALALDLSLRTLPGGKASLDGAMRRLWRASGGGPIAEADIVAAVKAEAGARRGAAPASGAADALAEDLLSWVHGTADLPLPALLAAAGVAWGVQAASLAQRWGLRVSESALTGVKVTTVLRGGTAERAGLAAGDELMAVEGWRVRRLEEATAWLPTTGPAQVLLSRDQRVLTLELTPPLGDDGQTVQGAVQLSLDNAAGAAKLVRKAWLNG